MKINNEEIKEYIMDCIKKECEEYAKHIRLDYQSLDKDILYKCMERNILCYSELNDKCHYEYMIENTKGIDFYIFFDNISILVDDKSNNTYSVTIYLCHKQNVPCDLKTTEFYIGAKFKIIDHFHFNIGINRINKN